MPEAAVVARFVMKRLRMIRGLAQVNIEILAQEGRPSGRIRSQRLPRGWGKSILDG